MSAFSDTRWHTRFVRYVFGRRARALCSRGNGMCALWAFSLKGKAPLSCVPFSRENWGDHLPPAARVQPLLRQLRDWVRGDRRWSLQTSLREEFFISRSTAADESKQREEDVLSVTSSVTSVSAHGGLMKAERIFPSLLSLSAPRCRAAGGYDVALLLGKPTVEARKRGSGSQ